MIKSMEPKKQKKEYTVALGGLFILLALIGLITIIASSVRLTKNLMDNTRQKEEFEQLLRPVVMFDPVPFNNPQEIDANRLLLYSMWSVLSDPSVNEYPRSEDGSVLLIPASDVGEQARILFGSEVTPEHATFTDNEKAYYYDKALATYEVATYGYLYVNQPEVLSIARDGDYYRLLISYIPPDNAWETVYAGSTTETFSRKSMYFVVKKVEGSWNLVAIMDGPRDGVEVDFTYVPVPYVPKEEKEEVTTPEGTTQTPEDEITASGTQPVLPVPIEEVEEGGAPEGTESPSSDPSGAEGTPAEEAPVTTEGTTEWGETSTAGTEEETTPVRPPATPDSDPVA